MSKPSNEVIQRYKSKTYKQVKVDVPKEMCAKFEEKLLEKGLTKAGFIKDAIKKFIEED